MLERITPRPGVRALGTTISEQVVVVLEQRQPHGVSSRRED
jgi:hypothetical protein